EVARDGDDVGAPSLRPVDRRLRRALSARGDPEVEVRQMDDPEPRELRREARKRNRERPVTYPPGLEPPPGDRSRDGRDGDERPEDHEAKGRGRTAASALLQLAARSSPSSVSGRRV